VTSAAMAFGTPLNGTNEAPHFKIDAVGPNYFRTLKPSQKKLPARPAQRKPAVRAGRNSQGGVYRSGRRSRLPP
jgi:hypothetical protein